MKKLISILTAAVLILTMASCSAFKKKESKIERNKNGDIIITVADYRDSGGSNLNNTYGMKIFEFNKADNGYEIVLKDYSGYNQQSGNGNYRNAVQQLEEDCMNGEVDIVFELFTEAAVNDFNREKQMKMSSNVSFMDGFSSFANLAKKGSFADLYQYINTDNEVNTQTLDERILKLSEIDGKLPYICPIYSVNYAFGNTSVVGTKENWTFDDMRSAHEKSPNMSVLQYSDRRNLLAMILDGMKSSFIDYSSRTADFENPKFLDILKFCKDSPENTWVLEAEPLFYGRGMQYFEGVGDSEYGFFDVDTAMDAQAQNEPFTLVGYPSEDGKGAYIDLLERMAICANSPKEVQEGAWQFLRTFFTSDPVTCYSGFPLNNEAFARMEQQALCHSYTDPDTGETEYFPEQDVPQETINRIKEYISKIDRLETYEDAEMYNIITDEALKYFNGGQTAEQAAMMIQSRVSIWLSETS